MKKSFVILIFYIFYGCNNSEIKESNTESSVGKDKVTNTIPNKYFETITYDKKFEFIVNETYKGSNAVSSYGIGYHLLIGLTQNSELPKKLSVLYHSLEPYNLKKGDTINIVPDQNQNFEEGIGIIYIASDTIINGKTETNVFGSENKSIWAERIEL